VLKHGGKLLIIAQKGKQDQIVNEPLMLPEKMFFNFFTSTRLKKMLKGAGFIVSRQKEVKSKDPDLMSDTIIYTYAEAN